MSRRPLIVALLAVVSTLSVAGTAHAAVGDLPRLTEGAPTGIAADWYDDHSVIGDDHLSWSPEGGSPLYVNTAGQTSQSEPKAIGFDPALGVSGAGGLEVCGYASGTVGWMRAYQAAPGVLTAGGSCPATEPAGGQFGWFRYVYGRHSPTDAFNRWHLMDLERFALVPLPASAGGPPDGTPTVWDNHWGTCLGLGGAPGSVSCPANRSAAGIDVGVAAGATQTTGIYYDTSGIIDEQVIPIPVGMHPINSGPLQNGLYQIVDLTNPYGLLQEAGGAIGSVSCATVNFSIGTSGADFGLVHVPVVDAAPTNCYLPTSLDPMLPGPGGFDPMAGADAILDCTFTGSHCWPGDTAPHSGPFPAAHTLATGNPSYIPSTTVANGSAIPEAISATGRRAITPGRTTAPAPLRPRRARCLASRRRSPPPPPPRRAARSTWPRAAPAPRCATRSARGSAGCASAAACAVTAPRPARSAGASTAGATGGTCTCA